MASEPPIDSPAEPLAEPLVEPLDPPRATAQGMIGRIRGILFDPWAEWARIEAEPASVAGLMLGWVAPLALIGPLAGLVRALVFGSSQLGIVYHPSIAQAVSDAGFAYAMSLVAALVLALIIDALAPFFGGTRDRVQAMKIAAYGGTAAYLVAVFQVVPWLGLLGWLGVYSLFLIYLGLPRLMHAPKGKADVYTLVTVVLAMLLFWIAASIAGSISNRLFPRDLTNASFGTGGAVPGSAAFDANKVNANAKQDQVIAEQAAARDAAGKQAAGATPPETLAAMLPASIGGWTRSAIASESGALNGVGTSHAEGTYTSGDKEFRLTITDNSTADTVGGAVQVRSSRQDENGYEKTGPVDNRMTTERWDKTGSGDYGVLFGNRFRVEAQGQAPDIATLKRAVAAVDTARLESMAK